MHSPKQSVRLALSVAAALAISSGAALAGDAHPVHWSYGGHGGPEEWGHLEKGFEACSLGHEQSPIDIPSGKAEKAKLAPLAFDYKPAPLKIIDNGHTIQVNWVPGSQLVAEGKTYELLQFHFHKPSEEKVDGKAYSMVAHLVHKSAEGKLAVVAVLVEAGKVNPFLKSIWAQFPKETGHEVAHPGVTLDLAAFLPKSKGYYMFKGSLTTPPCSEDVTWYVLRQPVEAEKKQVEVFGTHYAMNARPVQPLNGRTVRASE